MSYAVGLGRGAWPHQARSGRPHSVVLFLTWEQREVSEGL